MRVALQPTFAKSTRTALHHPHHGGDKSGATLAGPTRPRGNLEMALLKLQMSQASDGGEQLSCRFARTMPAGPVSPITPEKGRSPQRASGQADHSARSVCQKLWLRPSAEVPPHAHLKRASHTSYRSSAGTPPF